MTADGAVKIKARAVERVFAADTDNPVKALGPLDIDIADGEFCCIVGPSGCGKSTFLRIVAGLVRPSAGTVEVALNGSSRTPIAMVFQDYGIYPWKTVEANVRFGLEVGKVPRKEAKERAQFWVAKLGLTEFSHAYPDTLSGGMRQRVAIARALAVEPEILLMDEPFAALDAQLRQLLQEELLTLWEADKRTVVFITHSLEEAIVLGDRTVVMTARPGRLLESVHVPFERPRTPELRAAPEFNAFKADLWDHLRLQVEEYLTQLRDVEETADD